MAVKLAARVTFDKRGGKKSHAHTFLSFFIHFGWTVKLLSLSRANLSPEPADVADLEFT